MATQPETHALALKTFGLADILRDALSPLSSDIDAAFVYASTAKRQASATTDVDVMMISESVGYGDM